MTGESSANSLPYSPLEWFFTERQRCEASGNLWKKPGSLVLVGFCLTNL
jgi:hypothetical protein